MGTQTTKTAKRPAKAAARTVKKPAKAAKSARGADKSKKASKSARNPVGKAAETARTLMAAARTSKIEASPRKMVVSPPVQPAAPEIVLKSHKYQVGETVYFTSPTFGRAAATGTYTVVKLLPSESDDYQYRIKSSGEAFERVAKESQLDKM